MPEEEWIREGFPKTSTEKELEKLSEFRKGIHAINLRKTFSEEDDVEKYYKDVTERSHKGQHEFIDVCSAKSLTKIGNFISERILSLINSKIDPQTLRENELVDAYREKAPLKI